MSEPAGRNRLVNEAWVPLDLDRLERIDSPASQSAVSAGKTFHYVYRSEQTDPAQNGFIASYAGSDAPLPGPEVPGELPELPVDPAVSAEQPPETPLPDVQKIEQDAYQEGFAKGEAAGFEAGVQRGSEVVERLEHILQETQTTWSRLITRYQDEIVELVCRAAEKVVLGQIAADRDVAKRVILHAFELIPEPVDVSIQVSPEDLEYIEGLKDDFRARVSGLENVSVVAAEGIRPGGCRITTQTGAVDASLETRLEAIEHSLRSVGRAVQKSNDMFGVERADAER